MRASPRRTVRPPLKRALRCSGLGLAVLLHCLTLPARALACVVGIGTSASCTESALNACLPGGLFFDGSAVTFNCGGSATITVTSTKTISADTTIDGGGVITISGGNSVGVFSVNTVVKFIVQNLTIANGSSGGGIYNNGGTLTVTNSTFSDNSAPEGGGIYNNSGTLTVTNSTFSGNSAGYPGGGIANGGTLTVTNSTFSGNSAGEAGGIYNFGLATVTNSTFSGNSVLGGSSGIFNSGTLTVTNSTFSGNSAVSGGGSIYNSFSGTVTVTNSTFSGNTASGGGGGIYNNSSGTVTVTNSIVANSTPGGNCAGAVTDGGHNIDDGTTCGFTGANCATTTGSSFCNTNPKLDPAGLANNGGPTQTIALQATSAAVDAGDDTVCSMTTGTAPVNNRDQRGFARPGGGHTHCSSGAFEFDSPPPPTDSLFLCSQGSNDGRACTRDADCPGGVCVVEQGICNGGDDDGEPCDCAASSCSLQGFSCAAPSSSKGTCNGGPSAGGACVCNCAGGATCVATQKVCVGGDGDGFSCLNSTQCGGRPCQSTGKFCAGFCAGGSAKNAVCVDDSECPGSSCTASDFDGFSCNDDANCWAGLAPVVDGICTGLSTAATATPTATPTRPPTQTPTPTDTPTQTPIASPTATPTVPQQLGAPCNSDGQCLSSHCTDGVCCVSATCPSGARCNISESASICAFPPATTNTPTPTTAIATPTPTRTFTATCTFTATPVQIQGLFNTGVDDSGSVLPVGTQERHYAMTGPRSPAFVVVTDGAWVAPPAGCAWIGWPNISDSPVGDYVYTLTFNLPASLDPTTAVISGELAADNQAVIRLHGVDTGFADGDGPAFSSLHGFTISNGFVSGINALEFTVTNTPGSSANPTGLLVANLSGSALPAQASAPTSTPSRPPSPPTPTRPAAPPPTSTFTMTNTPTPTGTPIPMAMGSVRLRANSGRYLPNGKILIRTTLDTSTYGDWRDDLSHGFTLELKGAGLSVPERMVFPGYWCFTLSKMIECIGSAGEDARFRPQRSGSVVSLKITATNRSFLPPLSSAGVTLTLSMGDLGMCGTMSSCTVRGHRKLIATCLR